MAEFHPSHIEQMATIFCNLPGCLLLGLDVFMRDHSQPCDARNHTIIDGQSRAGIPDACLPMARRGC